MSATRDGRGVPVQDKLALDKAVRSFSMRRTGMPVSLDASYVIEVASVRYVVLRNDTGAHVATYRCLRDGAVVPDTHPPPSVLGRG